MVKYQQGYNPYCLHYSFASAMHHVGLRDISFAIADLARKNTGIAENWKSLVQEMRDRMGWLQCTKFTKGRLDPLTNISIYPTLLILQGENGSIDHAVTTVGEWLFDANRRHAERITKELLDWCVSSDEEASSYKQVYLAFRFAEQVGRTKKIRYRFEG